MKAVNFRLSDDDQKWFDTIANEIGTSSPAAVIKTAIRKYGKILCDQPGLLAKNGLNRPEPVLPTIDPETGEQEINPYKGWIKIGEGWDYNLGEWAIQIRQTFKPFKEAIITSNEYNKYFNASTEE